MNKRGRPQVWTKEAIIRAIKRFRRQQNHWPEFDEFTSHYRMPSVSTVRRHFTTLAGARRAAGMPGGGFEGAGGADRRPLGAHWRWGEGKK